MNRAPDDLRAELAALLDDLRDTQAEIRALSARVLLDPTAEDQAEPDRHAHLQRRRDLLARIASVVLRAVDAGGTIKIDAAAPDRLAIATMSEPPATESQTRTDLPPATGNGTPNAGDATVQAVDEAASDPAVPITTPSAVQPPAPTVHPDPVRLQAALGPAWARQQSDAEAPACWWPCLSA